VQASTDRVRPIRRAFLVGIVSSALGIFAGNTALAHEQQKNRLTIVKQDANCLGLSFVVSAPPVLHQLLGQKQTFDAFLNKYAGLSPEHFQKDLEKALNALEKGALFKGPDDRRIPVRKWVWAPPLLWQQSIQEQRALLMAGAGNTGHPNPVVFTAEACSKRPISRLMLGFDPSLYPLSVEASKTDQFWLTVDIPTAIADF